MKSIITTNPDITENTECMIVKVHAPVIDVKWVCHLNTVYHYASFTSRSLNFWLPFQGKNNVRSTPACTTLSYVSHQSQNEHTANCHLHSKGERNGVQRRTKVSFGRTMIQALKLLRLAKKHM